MAQTGFILHWKWKSGWLLRTKYWNYGLHKMMGIYSLLHATNQGCTRIKDTRHIQDPLWMRQGVHRTEWTVHPAPHQRTWKTSDWSNLTNQRLLNTASIMIISSDYKTLNSSLQRPATWIVSSEKPSKLRCIQTTSTEMGDSASANPGNHCYIDSRKGDSHWVHNSDPTPTRTYICLPLPQSVVTPPAPSGHFPSHWLRHFPTTTPSGINTPHVPSQSFFIHLPMNMEPIEGSETSAIRTKTPENYPKENILHIERVESLKSRVK